MDPTVTTNDPRGDVTPAARLASVAARTVGALTTSAVSDVERAQLAALSSIALSLADPPLPRFAVQIGTAEPEPAAGTVPLASADTLPDDLVDEVVGMVRGRPMLDLNPANRREVRDYARRVTDAVNAKLREQFPDETPTQPEAPAPFVRGVDELSRDEVEDACLAADLNRRVGTVNDRDMAVARRLFGALSALMAQPAPDPERTIPYAGADKGEPWTEFWGKRPEEPKPAEITAAMLDAAHVGATVADANGRVWRKRNHGRWDFGTFCRSSGWLIEQGPLADIELGPAETTQVIDRKRLTEAWSKDEAYDTRDALTAAALRAAAEWFDKSRSSMELLASQGSANADLDAAAREHVTALGGPATGGVIATPGFAVTDEDVESFFDAQRDSGDRTRVSLRDFERRAMEHYARRLASRETGTVIAAPRGLPELSEADVQDALGIYSEALDQSNEVFASDRRRTALRAALRWYRLRLAGGTPSTGGYDPAKLADGSVILADGRTYTRSAYWGGCSELKWLASPPDGHRCAVTDVEVPLDGTLVVDGATLGGAQ